MSRKYIGPRFDIHTKLIAHFILKSKSQKHLKLAAKKAKERFPMLWIFHEISFLYFGFRFFSRLFYFPFFFFFFLSFHLFNLQTIVRCYENWQKRRKYIKSSEREEKHGKILRKLYFPLIFEMKAINFPKGKYFLRFSILGYKFWCQICWGKNVEKRKTNLKVPRLLSFWSLNRQQKCRLLRDCQHGSRARTLNLENWNKFFVFNEFGIFFWDSILMKFFPG